MARTFVDPGQIAYFPSFIVPHPFIEEPTNQSGDTFTVRGHNPAYAFKVWRNGLLLRQTEITKTILNAVDFTFKLQSPLGANDRIQWERWA